MSQKNSQFNIIFEGDLLPNHKQASVQAKLARIFGMPTSEADTLFSGKQHKLKSDVSIDKAKQYIFAMAKLGAMAYMIPVDASIKSTAKQSQKPGNTIGGKFTETGSFDIAAYSAYFAKAQQEEPEEKSSDHKIFNLDEIDVELNKPGTPLTDVSGVHNVMKIESVSKITGEHTIQHKTTVQDEKD